MILLEIIIIIRFKNIQISRKQLNLLENITSFLNLKNKLQYISVTILFTNKIK